MLDGQNVAAAEVEDGVAAADRAVVVDHILRGQAGRERVLEPDGILVREIGDLVPARVEDEAIRVGSARQGIVPGTSVEDVGPFVAAKDVGSGSAGELVVVETAFEQVDAGAAGQQSSPRPPIRWPCRSRR